MRFVFPRATEHNLFMNSPLRNPGADPLPHRDLASDVLATSAVLVVDDEPGMCNFLQRALKTRCGLVEVADSVEMAENIRKRAYFDLMILDIRLPGMSGVAWLQELRAQGNRTEVIFITAYADLETAIEALRAGASDFILKPFRLEQITAAVKRCLEQRRMRRENLLLRREVGSRSGYERIIGNSDAIKGTCRIINQIAASSATVLVEGETGTGKELVARAIHDLSGRSGVFVALNCGSIPPELIESELFGHLKGAFTGAHQSREGLFHFAHEGTLFLDEIGEMSLSMQAKLLRVLDEKQIRPVGSERETPVNVRVIAATNRRLVDRVQSGEFRQDLFYRLEVVTITVPTLRDRLEDIPALAEHFVNDLSAELGVQPLSFTHGDISILQRYWWPGNVRELKNVIERFLLLGKLPDDLLQVRASSSQATGFPPNWSLAEVEKHHIRSVVGTVGGNKSEAARRLGISRKTLERKMRE